MADQNENAQEQAPQEATEEQQPLEQEEQAPSEEAKADDAEGGEEAEVEEQSEESAAAAEEKRRNRATGYQRKLLKKDTEIEFLRAQLAQLQGQPKPTESAKELSPEEKLAEYMRNEVRQQLERERAAERQRAEVAAFQQRVAEFAAKTPDYEEAIEDVAHIPVPREVQEAILTSERSPEIMYSLAKNPAELARISALPPLRAALEIGRLAEKLSAGAATPSKPKPSVRPPAPPTTVSGKSASTRSLEDLPISEYKRRFRSGER